MSYKTNFFLIPHLVTKMIFDIKNTLKYNQHNLKNIKPKACENI